MLSTAALAALLTTGGASAQGWYVSVLGGTTIDTPHINIGGGHATPQVGFNGGGRFGYDLDDVVPWSGFALETDIFYNQAHFVGSDSARRDSLSFMGDLIYHVPTGWPVGIYGGAGIGAVNSEVYANSTHDDSTVLGWQALGGVDYAFAPDTKLFAEYRYQQAHDANLDIPVATRVGNTTNNVSVGVKFDL
ncbi:MAG TPA: outer membrane beta-barrel protein [Rhizomicrobium sp.]|nr:outer membrane beta-barrel protein [Rhizomicrobium sp.]